MSTECGYLKNWQMVSDVSKQDSTGDIAISVIRNNRGLCK